MNLENTNMKLKLYYLIFKKFSGKYHVKVIIFVLQRFLDFYTVEID